MAICYMYARSEVIFKKILRSLCPAGFGRVLPIDTYIRNRTRAFEQITGKVSFLSFSFAELEVFSFPSSSTEFSAA